jgi:hypothetical protein
VVAHQSAAALCEVEVNGGNRVACLVDKETLDSVASGLAAGLASGLALLCLALLVRVGLGSLRACGAPAPIAPD